MDDGPRNIEQAMETTTPFDLNSEIARWRQTLSQSPAIRVDNLDELESHLRDTVEELEGKGLSTEEAFVLATRRLGPTKPIEAEFAKVNASGVWLHRVLWMLIGVQAWALIQGVSSFAANAVLTGSVAMTGLNEESGSIYSTLVPGSAFLITQLSVVVVIMVAAWWAVAKSSRRFKLSSQSIRTFVFLGVGLGTLILYGSGFIWTVLSLEVLSVEQFGRLAMSKQIAAVVLKAILTLGVAVITVLLANHLFGSKRTLQIRSQQP